MESALFCVDGCYIGMKGFFVALGLAVAGAIGLSAWSAEPVVINYKVNYQVAFIMKEVARGTVELQSEGPEFSASLNGRSIPWGGRVYEVSDTLRISVVPGSGPAYMRLRETARSGWYFKPLESRLRDGSFNRADPANYRNTAGQGQLSCSPLTIEAVGISTDMLGMFYVFRELDFSALEPGQQLAIPVGKPDGGEQYAYVTYTGLSECGGIPAYGVVCEFSYDGERSSYPVTCQVDSDTRLILSMSAHLDIGRMEMVMDQE